MDTFQTKDFTSICASMINWMRVTCQKISDFSVGSVARTMLEAVAIEIDELYQQVFNGIMNAIPVAIYNSFSFPAIGSSTASGLIRVTVTSSGSAVLIPAGTVASYSASSLTYVSQADVTIAAGNTYADIEFEASQSGSIGNIASGIVFTLSPVPVNLVSATNLAPFQNGLDAESSSAQKLRFNAFVQTLQRGTVAAIEYGLKTTTLYDSAGNVIEQVVAAAVIEPYETDNTQPVGLINCYVHNGVGGTSAALVAQALVIVYGYTDASGNKVAGWKAAGTHCTVAAATEVDIAVTAAITTAPGYVGTTLVSEVSQAIYTYIIGLDLGQSCLFAKIIDIAMNTPGVANFIVSTPTVDQTATNSQKLMPGTFTITAS